MISDEVIARSVNETLTEELIRGCENQILWIMKKRQENYPSEQSDREWLEFSQYVNDRRNKHRFS